VILEVDEVGYADAVEAFRAGNHAAAHLVSRLTTQLAGTGHMAGTDTGAAEFAAAYDDTASETLRALVDATHALATLGRTTAACDTRHREAEHAAITPGAVVDPGCTPPPADSWLAPLPTTPPTALGGDDPHLSDHENWILDHAGGIVWPDGNPTRLRSAATAWRTTAESVHGLTDTLTTAADALHTQRSPEIPLALAACDDLRTVLLDLADQCSALATQCDDYAAAIETAHTALRALLTELLMMVVEGMVVSAALAAVTAGAGAAAGLATIAARIATTAPRFHHILTLLRAARTAATTALRTTHAGVTAARARLTRFLRVPVRRPTSFGPRSLGAAHRLRYEASPKHHVFSRGRASPPPREAQEALDFSVPLGPTTSRRISVDPGTGSFVVFDETTEGVFHGHLRSWNELTHTMQNALVRSGTVDRKGRLLEGGE
jgi:hypothetical protein